MDEHSKNSPSFFKSFSQLELEGFFNIRDEWIVEVLETENVMDQNDASTKANDCQYDYPANAANYTASANFECSGETMQQYTVTDESVVAAPVNTDSNITDANQYNYLPQTNYYDSSSVPPPTYERLNQDETVGQPTAYETYTTADTNSEHVNQYLHVLDHQTFPYGSEALQPNVEESHNFPQNTDHVNVNNNDLSNRECVNVNQTQMTYGEDIPVIDNGYSEEVNNVPCYTEPSQETVVETGSGYSENICVTDSTWNVDSMVNKEEIQTMEADTNSSICETQETSAMEESNAEQPQLERNSVPALTPEPPAPEIITIDNKTMAQKDENETNNIANGEISKTEIEVQNVQMCIRSGCLNRAINNPEWEQEFCSNDCVIIHCRNVFMAWVKANETVSQ